MQVAFQKSYIAYLNIKRNNQIPICRAESIPWTIEPSNVQNPPLLSLWGRGKKLKRLTAERKKRDAESVAIGGMLFELTELEAPPIEFDEKLWHAVVDRVTVYNDDRLVYSLKDGTEITIELWARIEKSPNSTWCDAVWGL